MKYGLKLIANKYCLFLRKNGKIISKHDTVTAAKEALIRKKR